jgi:hypothetical protein
MAMFREPVCGGTLCHNAETIWEAAHVLFLVGFISHVRAMITGYAPGRRTAP